jgi:hypothetical protein
MEQEDAVGSQTEGHEAKEVRLDLVSVSYCTLNPCLWFMISFSFCPGIYQHDPVLTPLVCLQCSP